MILIFYKDSSHRLFENHAQYHRLIKTQKDEENYSTLYLFEDNYFNKYTWKGKHDRWCQSSIELHNIPNEHKLLLVLYGAELWQQKPMKITL